MTRDKGPGQDESRLQKDEIDERAICRCVRACELVTEAVARHSSRREAHIMIPMGGLWEALSSQGLLIHWWHRFPHWSNAPPHCAFRAGRVEAAV